VQITADINILSISHEQQTIKLLLQIKTTSDFSFVNHFSRQHSSRMNSWLLMQQDWKCKVSYNQWLQGIEGTKLNEENHYFFAEAVYFPSMLQVRQGPR